jgi:hypothetical protein
MNYIQLVNDVLIRLREPEASSVSDNAYVKLIARFVNDSKRVVEDSYNWNCLGSVITVTTAANTSSYSLTGAGQKFRVNDVINTTSLIGLRNIAFVDMNRKLNFSPTATSIPSEFTFSGVDGSGDTKVDLFPVPSGVFTILFDLVVPQANLSADGTSVKV